MEVDTRLMRIHLMIVVNREGIAFCHIHWEYHIVESVHGDTQLYAITVHEVVSRNIQIVLGLVVDATGKEVRATVVVSLLVGVLGTHGLEQPGLLFVKLCCCLSVLVSLQLADVPEVSVGCESLVGSNLHLVFLQTDHLTRQGTVVDGDMTGEVRSLHIFDGEEDGIGIFNLFSICIGQLGSQYQCSLTFLGEMGVIIIRRCIGGIIIHQSE